MRAIAIFLLCLFAFACSAPERAPDPGPHAPPAPVPARPGAEGKTSLLGVYTGTFSSGKLTLKRQGRAAPTEIGPTLEAFQEVSDSLFAIETTDSGLGGTTVNGQPCPTSRFCAEVSVTNGTSKAYNDVFIEITSITAGYEGANSTDLSSSSVFFGYPLDNSKGLWAYGNLAASGGNASVFWEFHAPDTNDFFFEASVFASKVPLSYGISSTEGGTAFVDACGLSGATTVIVSNTSGGHQAIPVPFPFMIGATPFRPKTGGFGVGARGTIGAMGPSSGPAGNLPQSSVIDTFLPFWSTLQTSSSGICYATTGSAGARKLYATWNHASFGGGEDITFTSEIHEATDEVVFVYQDWAAQTGDCHSSDATEGAGTAVIGVMGHTTAGPYAEFGTLAGYKLASRQSDFLDCGDVSPTVVTITPIF